MYAWQIHFTGLIVFAGWCQYWKDEARIELSIQRERERIWADGGIVPFKICFVCEFGFGFSAWGLGMEQGGSYYDM